MLQLLCHRGYFFLWKYGCFCALLNWPFYPRVTSAAIARSPKGALATRADQKGACFSPSYSLSLLTTCPLGSHISRDCPSAGGANDGAA